MGLLTLSDLRHRHRATDRHWGRPTAVRALLSWRTQWTGSGARLRNLFTRPAGNPVQPVRAALRSRAGGWQQRVVVQPTDRIPDTRLARVARQRVFRRGQFVQDARLDYLKRLAVCLGSGAVLEVAFWS